MSATIHTIFITCTILQLLPITRTTFTQSSDPVLDVECLNNYKKDMTCSLISTELNCSQYKLCVSLEEEHLFNCSLEQINSSVCECKSQVQKGFVVGEDLKVNVLRREKSLFIRDFTTADSIKPDRPVIISVKQSKNENFNIIWTTNYDGDLSGDLIPELSYSIAGSNIIETKKMNKGLTSYEIVGRNLHPNTNYIVWARVKFYLSERFSDYSEPYIFKTPSSIQDILKVTIPILCILLIICISTIFYCYHKIISEWWHKVPQPKIAAAIKKQVPNLLLPSSGEFSPVYLDSSHLDRNGQKTWIPQFDITSQNSFQSIGKDGNSSQVDYAPVCDSVEDNSRENSDLSRTLFFTNMENLKPNTTQFGFQNEGKKCSGIENKTYDKSSTDHLNQRNTFFIPLFKSQKPQIETDFNYSSFTGPFESTNIRTIPVHNTPVLPQTALVPGYQSVTEVMDCGNKSTLDASVGQTFVMFNKNPQNDVLPTIWKNIPVESEWKDVRSLCINTDKHSLEVNPSLLNIPCIEMDSSYHRV